MMTRMMLFSGVPTRKEMKKLPRMRFPRGVKFPFFQDMGVGNADFSGREWYVKGIVNDAVVVCGPGNGMKGDYGNGSIYITLKEVDAS